MWLVKIYNVINFSYHICIKIDTYDNIIISQIMEKKLGCQTFSICKYPTYKKNEKKCITF